MPGDRPEMLALRHALSATGPTLPLGTRAKVRRVMRACRRRRPLGLSASLRRTLAAPRLIRFALCYHFGRPVKAADSVLAPDTGDTIAGSSRKGVHVKGPFLVLSIALAVSVAGCSFSEFVQEEDVIENIDDYRTGCEIDTDALMAGYKQYQVNELHYDSPFDDVVEPTPTPRPISDSELSTSSLLEKAWENGCQTGRRDATDAQQATLMSLRDQLEVLDARIAALEPTPTPTATPAATATPAP